MLYLPWLSGAVLDLFLSIFFLTIPAWHCGDDAWVCVSVEFGVVVGVGAGVDVGLGLTKCHFPSDLCTYSHLPMLSILVIPVLLPLEDCCLFLFSLPTALVQSFCLKFLTT